jgi:hypothetical protein
MKRCPYCQTENQDMSSFCSNCGSKLENEIKPEAPEFIPEGSSEKAFEGFPPESEAQPMQEAQDEWQSVGVPGFSSGPQAPISSPPIQPYHQQAVGADQQGQAYQQTGYGQPQSPYPPQPAYPPAPKSPKKNKGLLIGILIGAILLLGLCVTLYLTVVKPFFKKASDPGLLTTLIIDQLITEVAFEEIETPEAPTLSVQNTPEIVQSTPGEMPATQESIVSSVNLPEVPGFKALFYDDFGPNTLMYGVEDGDIETVIKPNVYEFKIKTENFLGYQLTDSVSVKNSVAQIDVELLDGHEYTAYALICRFGDDDNYTLGGAAYDGWITLRQYINGEPTYLVSRFINGISEPKNTLSMACVDDTITLFVNGLQVATAIDPNPITGDVGFSTINYSTEPSTVGFSQFKVYEVEGNEAITSASDLPFTSSIQSKLSYEDKNYFYQNNLLDESDISPIMIAENEYHKTSWEDGKYLLTLKEPNRHITVVSSKLNYMNMLVNATVAEFDHDATVGVICRYQGVGNFYGFGFANDGWTTIYKYVNGNYTELYGEYRDGVVGAFDNFIVGNCVDDSLTLMINGEMIAEVKDGDLLSGDGGLISLSYKDAPVSVQFKYFMIFPVNRD